MLPDGTERGLFDSQLKSVVAEVKGAGDILIRSLPGENDRRPIGDFYAECQKTDRRIGWLWQAWAYFRERFDQRDHPAFQDFLRVVDEVVWSCYRPAFGDSSPPPPLPCVSAIDSPVAFERYKRSVLPDGGDELRTALESWFQSLPVSVIELPAAAIRAPWMLVLIGHEVGHVVLAQFEADHGHGRALGEMIGETATLFTKETSIVSRWKGQTTELFADWYSVCVMGSWAAWAVYQMERVGDPLMLAPRHGYPRRLVRLAFLAELARRMGIQNPWTVDEPLSSLERLARDAPDVQIELQIVRKLAERLSAWRLPGAPVRLQDLIHFRAADYDNAGEVSRWSQALRKLEDRSPAPALRTPRLISAGVAHAWSEIMKMEKEGDRLNAFMELDSRAAKLIAGSGEPGKRSGSITPPAAPAEPGRNLAELLLRTTVGI